MSDDHGTGRFRDNLRRALERMPREHARHVLNARGERMFPGCDDHDEDTPGCPACDGLFHRGLGEAVWANVDKADGDMQEKAFSEQQRKRAAVARGSRGWLSKLLRAIGSPATFAEVRSAIENLDPTVLEDIEEIERVTVEDDGDAYVVAELVDGTQDKRRRPDVMRAALRVRRQ